MDMSSRPGFYEIFRGKDSGKKVTGMNGYVVEMNNIRKSFGSVQAVKDGQFNLKKGEIHSLIGENGTGKSTMMKLLYGLYDFDGGDIKTRLYNFYKCQHCCRINCFKAFITTLDFMLVSIFLTKAA